MKILSRAILVLMLTGCSAGTPVATSTAPPGITVGPNVQVSLQNANLAHGEELIAADPANPQHLLACSSLWLLHARAYPHGGIREVAYVSSDGGASWKQTQLTNVGAFDLDPVCAIGNEGVAYFGGASAYDPSPGHDWLARSTDGGMHWSAPSIFPWGDRDFIAVDTSKSPYRGRLYDVSLNAKRASKGEEIASADLGEVRSIDSGASYLQAVTLFHNPKTHSKSEPVEYYSGPVTVLRNGHVVEVAYNWPDSATPKKVAVFVSTDGGASFSQPRVVTSRAGSELIGTSNFKEEGASVLPLVASDNSTGLFGNRVYVAWQDFTKREYGRAAHPAPQGALLVAHSDDEGKTWSAPVEADDAPTWPTRKYPEVFAPEIAVNKDGIVAVTWFDARNVSDGTGGTLRMAVSNDGGVTFGSSFEVAAAPALLVPDADKVTLEIGSAAGETHFMQDLRYHVFGQDTQGLVADAAGNFHPLWVDNRTGTAQLWTDSVGVGEQAIKNGDPSLSKLADVSKSIGLEIVGGVYDRKTRNVTADAILFNSSKHAIRGPIRMRLTGVTSELGQASIDGGTILTFVPAHGSALVPKAETKPVHLTFHIDNVHPITADDVTEGAINYVSIAYQAFAQ